MLLYILHSEVGFIVPCNARELLIAYSFDLSQSQRLPIFIIIFIIT